MNTNQVCPIRCSKPLPVRLAPFPVDERAVYIDSICAVLIDSRFGPGRSIHRFEVHLSEYPELNLDTICDLANKSPFATFIAAEADTAGRRVRSPHVSKDSSSDVSPHDQTISSPTHARGSPQISLGRPFFLSPAATNIKAWGAVS